MQLFLILLVYPNLVNTAFNAVRRNTWKISSVRLN